MARERMVTRTIVSVNYSVMVADVSSNTLETIVISIPSGDTMRDKEREKAIKASIPVGKLFVTITAETVTETLYGMSESDFMKHAKVLPPRTKSE